MVFFFVGVVEEVTTGFEEGGMLSLEGWGGLLPDIKNGTYYYNKHN